jgi:hypothetical protein
VPFVRHGTGCLNATQRWRAMLQKLLLSNLRSRQPGAAACGRSRLDVTFSARSVLGAGGGGAAAALQGIGVRDSSGHMSCMGFCHTVKEYARAVGTMQRQDSVLADNRVACMQRVTLCG